MQESEEVCLNSVSLSLSPSVSKVDLRMLITFYLLYAALNF